MKQLNCRTIWFWAAALMFFAGTVMAVDGARPSGVYRYKPTEAAQETEKEEMVQPEYLRSANKLVGSRIENRQDQYIGRVRELILCDTRDVVHYVIVSSRGNLHPVPWCAFDAREKSLTLDISRDRLNQAPTVKTIDLQQLATPQFRQSTEEFYSTQISAVQRMSRFEMTMPMMRETEQPRLYAFGDIRRLDIKNLKDEQLGRLRDVVIDVRNGAIAYGFASYGGWMGIGQTTAAVPWASMKVTPALDVITLDATRETLDASTVDPRDMQQLAQPQFARRIHNNFDTEPYWQVFGFAPAEEVGMSMIPWRAGSMYNRRFDPAKMTTFEGTIKSVASYYPETGAAPGCSLTVESKELETHTVYAGPRHYAAAKNIDFKTGAAITVKGSKVTVEGKPVIMASEITTEGRTLRLYDEKGQPLWKFEEMK